MPNVLLDDVILRSPVWVLEGLTAWVLQRSRVVILSLLLVLSCLAGGVMAQSPPNKVAGVPVMLDDQAVFWIQDRFLSSSQELRAARISKRLTDVADDPAIALNTLQASSLDNVTTLHAEDVVIMTVSNQDAKLTGLDRQTLASNYLESMRRAVQHYREQRSAARLTQSLILVITSTIALILSGFILNNLAPRLHRWLDQQRNQRIPNLQIQSLELISSDQLSDLLLWLTSSFRFVFSLSLLYFYCSFVLGLFPQTRVLSQTMSGYLQSALNASWTGFLAYLPNLVTIGLVIAIAYFFLKFANLIFSGIRRQVFSIPGFYPEWAEPTYKLLTYLVLALSAAIIFPYLPGASSPAFQGVSLFLGALVSLGATGAISNIVAGFVLVYTRAFQIGDRVKVGDVVGQVEEKLLLVTRIRNLNNMLVTIPNAMLMNGNITNYSALLRDTRTPLILATTVTLGYDLPWRLVHETLITAALETPSILAEPSPFVLQTALNDFYISYELKAFTWDPNNLPALYSALHQNIQDQCNEAGIEICSPHYAALRDGNHTTTPANYLPEDYAAPGFRVESRELFGKPSDPAAVHSSPTAPEKS